MYAGGQEVDCNESGSTLRFLIPILSALGGGRLTGKQRLSERPLNVYQDVFSAQGLVLKQGFPLDVPAGLSGGEIKVAGDVSSQFITGLMLAAPLMKEEMCIVLTSPLESSAYVKMTIQAMAAFGVNVKTIKENQEYLIKPGQPYQASEATVEGDWSQAGFWLLAGLSSDKGIKITGLDMKSIQGDRVILDILFRMGAAVSEDHEGIRVKRSSLNPCDVDISQCPDLAPVVAGLMALSGGACTLSGGTRLRIKESDRIQSIADTLNRLGSRAEIIGDSIRIAGKPLGGRIKTHRDHRIAMMAAALSAHCCHAVVVDDETVVNKSYPAFWDDFKHLGGFYE
jgi:3-phosphoshikimate 1-carboxyvinyltransferase